jgi:hypothetical protein
MRGADAASFTPARTGGVIFRARAWGKNILDPKVSMATLTLWNWRDANAICGLTALISGINLRDQGMNHVD